MVRSANKTTDGIDLAFGYRVVASAPFWSKYVTIGTVHSFIRFFRGAKDDYGDCCDCCD